MPPVPMGAQQVRPQQSFKYTPTARNPPAQECHLFPWELNKSDPSRVSSIHQQPGTPQLRNATCSHGSSASQTPAEFQVYTNSQEPPSSGDARPDGCTRRSSSSTTSCAGPGSGTSDCFHVGCCSSSGTEADVG